MDLSYPPDAEAFRATVRSWLHEALPAGWFDGVRPSGRAAAGIASSWNIHLHETGWATPTWPIEYGGRGLSTIEAIVLAEELADAGAPIQPPAGGEILLGPTLLHWGTDEQKRRFLPPIARGTETWCQGFSEPEAGSDLASLTTSAVRDGDVWVITGHKIWTSEAPYADLCFMLVRTEPDQPRHRGISYLLVELDQPGVEVRAIGQPDGTAGFAEVLLDGARCPIATHTVGPPGQGWNVAMSTLGFERGTSPTSSWQRFDRDLRAVVAESARRGMLSDALLRQRIARAHTDIQLLRIATMRIVTGIVHPEHAAAAGAVAAGVKVMWTELQQRLTTLAIDVQGADGQILVDDGAPAPGVGLGHREPLHVYPASATQRAFLFAPSGRIFGGTSEIQRNIIGERVLGLPKEPRVTDPSGQPPPADRAGRP